MSEQSDEVQTPGAPESEAGSGLPPRPTVRENLRRGLFVRLPTEAESGTGLPGPAEPEQPAEAYEGWRQTPDGGWEQVTPEEQAGPEEYTYQEGYEPAPPEAYPEIDQNANFASVAGGEPLFQSNEGEQNAWWTFAGNQEAATPAEAEPAAYEAPAAELPVAEMPPVEVPVTDEVPVAEMPVAEVPVAEVPVAEVPVADETPVAEMPVAEVPVMEIPPAKMPAEELPVTDETLVAEVPVMETPPAEMPAEELPVADEAPAVEMPADEVPVTEEVPVAEATPEVAAEPEPDAASAEARSPDPDDPVAAAGLYIPADVELLEDDMPVYGEKENVPPRFAGEGLGEPFFIEFSDLANTLVGLRRLLPKGARLTYNYDYERAWIRSSADIDLASFVERVKAPQAEGSSE